MFERTNKKTKGEFKMFDYLDELIYCSDYLDPEYIKTIDSDDQYYNEVVKKAIVTKVNFNDTTRA